MDLLMRFQIMHCCVMSLNAIKLARCIGKGTGESDGRLDEWTDGRMGDWVNEQMVG